MPSDLPAVERARISLQFAASSSFVRNSERIGSLDIAITYTLFCVRRSQYAEDHVRGIISESEEGFFLLTSPIIVERGRSPRTGRLQSPKRLHP